jgi:DNA-binding response OmpR family regulator
MATVLVIDDDPGIRELLMEVLTLEGHYVSAAASGIEGLRPLHETTRRAIVILNWMMPRIDGLGGMRALNATTEVRSRHTVLLCSGHANVETLARELGADGVIYKPFDLDHLLAVVERTEQSLADTSSP